MIVAVAAEGIAWWTATFPERSSVKKEDLFNALLQCPKVNLPQMPVKETMVFLGLCLENKTMITSNDWQMFLTRFGPFPKCVVKAALCFKDNDGLAPWFHGVISRVQAMNLVNPSDDGAFLVRFSETRPGKFTLTYMKVHNDPLYNGRKEVKNVLIVHDHEKGYGLEDVPNAVMYPTIASFIEASAPRLRTSIVSQLSIETNAQLRQIRSSSIMFNSQVNGGGEYGTLSGTDLVSIPPIAGLGINNLGARPKVGQDFDYGPVPAIVQPAANDEYGALSQDDLRRPNNGGYGSFQNGFLLPQRPMVEANRSITTNFNASGGIFAKPQTAGLDVDYGRLPPQPNLTANKSNNEYRNTNAGVSKYQDPGAYGNFSEINSLTHGAPLPNSTFSSQPPPISSSSSKIGGSLVSPDNFAPARRVSNDSTGDPYGSFAEVSLDKRFTSNGSSKDTYGNFGQLSLDKRSISGDSSKDTYGNFGQLSLDKRSTSSDSSRDNYGSFGQLSLDKRSTSSDSSKDNYGSFDQLSLDKRSTSNESYPARVKNLNQPKEDALTQIERGMNFYKQKNLDEAIKCFLRAEFFSKMAGEKTIEARALGNLGTVYLDQKRSQEAITQYVKCLFITRDIEDKKRERTILNNLVLACMAIGDNAKALKYSQELLNITTMAANRAKIESRIQALQAALANK